MDKGAHYHKCDFQVHSPRDLNWNGDKFGVNSDQVEALTEDQKKDILDARLTFAKEYLQKVRDNGLNAIAITDHHDVVFAKIIRQVAESENTEFIAKNESDKCVTVFPGIEITLSTPNCQCLLILDSNLPDAQVDSALSMFGVIPSHEYDRQTSGVERIPTEQISNLPHLHQKLDNLPFLKGRYILLPNLCNGGQSTLLRAGAQEHYKKMPCVGGYVDKAIPTGDSGWTNKLNGGDINYGNKPVSIVSTSDNRYEDGREFGKYYTWIKWAEPSAEALRQACLAKQSRISQDEPQIPQITITNLDVTNSKFLGSFSLDFNKQYNALIGGRGTGKSTVLEYLRWGLCDQTVAITDLEDLNDIERRRKKLIDKTLKEFDGEVRVTFSLNEVNHIIKRNSRTNEIMLKINGGDFQHVSEEEIRRILPIQAYSQKQLSGVGVSTEELKRFIESPIAAELGSFDFQLTEISSSTRSEYLNVNRKRELERERDQLSLEINSLNTQAASLRLSLTGISEEQQSIIAKKVIYDTESSIISIVKNEFNSIIEKISDLREQLGVYPQGIDPQLSLENSEVISRLDESRRAKIAEVNDLLSQISIVLNTEHTAEVTGIIKEWETVKAAFDAQYEAAKSSTTSNQQQLIEIQRIETRLTQLRQGVQERQTKLTELGDPDELFSNHRTSYWALHREKLRVLADEARKFTALSKGLIQVHIEKNIDSQLLRSELVQMFQGTRINQEKIQAIVDEIIGGTDPLVTWDIILNELKRLAELKETDLNSGQQIPECLKLSEMGLNEVNLQRIAEQLTEDTWLSSATVKIEFTPDFKYTTNTEMEDVISFSEASAGQQATALLTVLLNQPGTPLLIDQPEDDIDNRAIEEIIESIWAAKKHRQIIFTSHNANLVVNGDAELVVCFDYRDSGNQTRGIIKAEGAIDTKPVKDEITSVMEGGEKAFKLRKDKYGY
ncbi:MAG: TrlF family AAA-like ATPase [Daejeonella sp.]